MANESGSAPTRPLALVLFDQTLEAHQLPATYRRSIGLASACYDAARAAGVEAPERAARDMLLSARLDGLDTEQQAAIAASTAMLRTRVRPQREPAFVCLNDRNQAAALRLGALLRLAAALADSGVTALTVDHSGVATVLTIAGQNTEALAEAGSRGEFWRDTIGRLEIRLAGDEPLAPLPDEPIDPAVARLTLRDGLQGDEPLAEGARRMLRRTFERFLARTDAVEKDEDPEDVHDMRVATRRLRASLQIVEGVFDVELMERFRRGLQRVARSLGAVRDYDVFLESVRSFSNGAVTERQAMMEPLLVAIAAARAPARARLLAELESKRSGRFVQRFAAFLTTPGAGVVEQSETGAPGRVRDFAGSAIWRRYEQWRAFDAVLDGAPDEVRHLARIAGKRLRYTIEFFADALGPGAQQALSPLMTLQELLGSLQDAVVAREYIRALGLGDDPGAQAYLAVLDAEHERLLAEFPRAWARVDSATYRRRLFELIIRV